MATSVSNAAAEQYDSLSTRVQEKWYHNLLSSCTIEEGFNCRDIGCGTGKNSAHLADIVGMNGRVVAIDPDEKRMRLAIQKYKRDNLKFKVARSIDIPSVEGGYDFVISNCVMHSVELVEKKETYRKLLKHMKPNAKLALVEVPKLNPVLTSIIYFSSIEAQNALNVTSSFFIDLQQSVDLFKGLGFDIVSSELVNDVLKFNSLDFYLNWADATLYGLTNSKQIYKDHKEEIPIFLDENGEFTIESSLSVIIVKKPKIN